MVGDCEEAVERMLITCWSTNNRGTVQELPKGVWRVACLSIETESSTGNQTITQTINQKDPANEQAGDFCTMM
jgi:hypothetical protein